MTPGGRRNFLIGAVVTIAMMIGLPGAAWPQTLGPVTNLPLPRFVSLKSDEVNVRVGPGSDYPISWTYVRFGLPVEIIAEYENWRRVRDANGNEGWVLATLLSGDRWAIVLVSNDGRNLAVHSDATETSQIVAYLEPGVQASVARCRDGWCRLTDRRFSGWVVQSRLWGVYPGENFN